MADAQRDIDAKVLSVFREMVGDRAGRLEGPDSASDVKKSIADAIAADHAAESASGIGFHLSDWGLDAAFLVALRLFPERLSGEEIKAGVTNLIIHAPNHLAAAAKLAGYPIQDVFGLGELIEDCG